mgnify:CR=1 FL=1
MQKRNIQWLYGELPGLVAEDILSAESAERLKAHYGPAPGLSGTRLVLIFFGILGGLLVGSGIILVFAYNWDDFGRPTRALLSMTPLVIGQILVGWTLYCRRTSAPWREGSASFLAMGVGASIALIGQTYHIPGDMAGFLFCWVLLALPLVYLLRSVMVAVLYMIGTTAWAAASQDQNGHALLYFPLLSGVLPFLGYQWRHHSGRPGTGFLLWVLCACLSAGLGIVSERNLPGLWIVTYSSLFALFCVVGLGKGSQVRGQPFSTIGRIGAVALSLLLTFEWCWRRIGFHHYRQPQSVYGEWMGIQDFLVVMILLAITTVLTVGAFRQKNFSPLPWVAAPLLALLGYCIASIENQAYIPSLFFNIYLFLLGIVVLTKGVKSERLMIANGGMGILALLFTARFFDGDMSILFRGVAFILIGLLFLGTNLWLARRFSAQGVEEVS